MSDPSDSYSQHAALFTRVYDLDDPSPYFGTLGPTGYRMPVALAAALEAIHAPLGAVRGAGHTPRLLDFACGYGVIGALLRHDVSMAEIYARYGERQWQPDDGRRYWEADAAFFAARRAERAAFEIAGIDIAGNALDYASALGFVDRAFHENLVDDAPGDGLKRFLHGVDVVVESGALGVMLPVAFERVFDCGGDGRPPWFLYSPRPDVNWTALNRLWSERGYRTESFCSRPVRYRKPLDAQERADMLRRSRGFGKPDEAIMRDGYFLVDLTLARPEAEPTHRSRSCGDAWPEGIPGQCPVSEVRMSSGRPCSLPGPAAPLVMPGLVPGIPLSQTGGTPSKHVDGRDKPGHDVSEGTSSTHTHFSIRTPGAVPLDAPDHGALHGARSFRQDCDMRRSWFRARICASCPRARGRSFAARVSAYPAPARVSA